MSIAPHVVVPATAKQLNHASATEPRSEDGFRMDGATVHMVRMIVRLMDARVYYTSAWKMCIAGDNTGLVALYFYNTESTATSTARKAGAPAKKMLASERRLLQESEDVVAAPKMMVVDVDVDMDPEEAEAGIPIPMEPDCYYVVHGTPHHPSPSSKSRAYLSVLNLRPLSCGNELMHHLLDCMNHHRGALALAAAAAATSTSAATDDEEGFFFGNGGSGDGDCDSGGASDML